MICYQRLRRLSTLALLGFIEIPAEMEAARAAGSAKLKDLDPAVARTFRLLFASVAFASIAATLVATSQLKLASPTQARRKQAELALSLVLRELGALDSKLQRP